MVETSVIIPAYNVSAYLEKCVSSVLEQTRGDFEVIVVNDGSTDSTPQICEQLRGKDRRVRVIHKPNGGVSSARNIGIQAATGEYVFFLDGDDWIPEYCLSDLHTLRERTHADIVMGNFCHFDDSKNTFIFYTSNETYYEKTFTPQELFAESYSMYANFRNCFIQPTGKLYPREYFRHVLYPVGVVPDDDYTTWKLYLLADKIAFVNKWIYVYRRSSDKMSLTLKSLPEEMYPLKSIEQRIAVLSMIGMDITQEIEAYRKRMAIRDETVLQSGTKNIEAYQEVQWMKQILEKYSV
ncbi:MAG: glycosyltransferase family 2 protein [Oribacterium sp.]|nr:glycosyltransferase family 2 protein [Oribacterium sp.]